MGEPVAHPRVIRSVLAAFLVTNLAVVALDVTTKHLAVSQLAQRPPVKLLGGALYLVLTRNSGAAFSFASGYTAVFAVVAFAVSGWICWLVRSVRSPVWAVALGLIFGGAVGNLVDRVFRAPGPFVGHVVDFISVFDAQGQGFPVFNVADSALCVGVTLAVLLELTGRRRDGSRAVAASSSAQEQPAVGAPAGGMPDSDRG